MADTLQQDDNGKTNDTQPPAPLSEKERKFQLHLSAANALIKSPALGMYGGDFVAPFSHQFKCAIRVYHPEDAATFDMTDRNENSAVRNAKTMRFITFCFYLVTSIALLLFLSGIFCLGFQTPQNCWIGFAFFILVALVTVGLRALIRREYLRKIANEATTFANVFAREMTSIHDRSIKAVQSSKDDQMMTASWPERSANWIKIALWFGKRYENLDRYVSATAWRVESRFRWIERIAISSKFFVLVITMLVAVLLWPAGLNLSKCLTYLAAIALYLFVSVYYWGLRPQKNNAFWGEKFRASIVGFNDQKEHINNQIARVIAGDKKLFMGGLHHISQESDG